MHGQIMIKLRGGAQLNKNNGAHLKLSEVIKKQKFFIRWQKLPYSYNRWLGNHSLKATYYVNQLFSSFYRCIRILMTLEAWNTSMHLSFNF
jgi:hypothetical protein